MSGELAALGALVVMHMIFSLIATAAIGQKTGTAWLLSSRSAEQDYHNSMAGRLDRARSNGFEALILFIPAILLVEATNSTSSLTVYAAWIFVGARLVYNICYAADMVPWRTIVWFVGWGAILALIGSAYFTS